MTDFGEQLRVLRKGSGLTLQDLAGRAQVSKSMISKIERGEVKPTVELAGRLALGLKTTLSDMLTFDCRPDCYYLAQSERHIETKECGCQVEVLSAQHQAHRLVWQHYVCPAKSRLPQDDSAIGDEICIVIEAGGLDVIIAGQRYEMYQGDSLFFDATCSYQFCNETNQTAEFTVVIKKRD